MTNFLEQCENYFTSRNQFFYIKFRIKWQFGAFSLKRFFLEGSQTLNFLFQMLNFISEDPSDLVDVATYLQSLPKSSGSCENGKTV